MLTSPHDEDLFDYYATAQLAFLDSNSGRTTPVGKPGLFRGLSISPNGNYLLVTRIHRPYSYLHPHTAFPSDSCVTQRLVAGKAFPRATSGAPAALLRRRWSNFEHSNDRLRSA